MDIVLAAIITVVSLATLLQHGWAYKGHFTSDAMPRGAVLLTIIVVAAAFTNLWALWSGPLWVPAMVVGLALQLASVALFWLAIAASRTARLLERGPSKMAKKLAEEAIEVVIDALNGKRDAVVRESADLLYNLAVLWAGAGVRPQDVWAEMDRRERMLGIAEKLPKSPANKNSSQSPALVREGVAAGRAPRRPIVALQGGRAGKHR